MIEVVAELSRGPVFLAGEALECVVTVTNPLPPTATSASRWGCWYWRWWPFREEAWCHSF